MEKAKKSKQDNRARNWTFIAYPESCEKIDLISTLDDLHIEYAISPLHDSDINADGTKKKPHYHVGLFFDGKKSYTQILEITQKLHCPNPQKTASVKGLLRYMKHLDNPEKYQYQGDIEVHGGLDLEAIMAPTYNEKRLMQKEIATFVLDNEIQEMADLTAYCIDHEKDDWLDIIMNVSTTYFSNLTRSIRHRRRND